jgi:hypothetical protein
VPSSCFEPIKPLERCNAVELRPARFMSDCEGLIFALREQLPLFLLHEQMLNDVRALNPPKPNAVP